jgi:phosphoglycolate phosphatase
MPDTRLVLFDIDGTILRGGGAGRRAMESALHSVFGTRGDQGFHYDGKTDRQIVRELMRLEGHADDHIDTKLDEILSHYLRQLEHEINDETAKYRPRLHVGVRELIDRLETTPSIVVGLLTGNIEPGARLKLASVGLEPDRFRVNAFGSDHERRPELPSIAQQRAKALLGIDVAGERVVVIGDTPADIHCGRSIGARAIAVATGRYSVDELREHDPWAVFENLADTERVMRAILG